LEPLLGMDPSLWPRVRELFVDWEHRGLEGLASSLELEVGRGLSSKTPG